MKYLTLLFFSFCMFIFVPKSQSFGQTLQDSTVTKVSKPDTLMKGKSPTGALLRSVIFPGGGQFYNRKYIKGMLVFGTETTLLTLAAVDWSRVNTHKRNFQNTAYSYSDRLWEFEQYQFYDDRRNLFLWITAGVIFLSMFDAYVDAQLYHFDQEKVRDLSITLNPEVNGGTTLRIVLKIPL